MDILHDLPNKAYNRCTQTSRDSTRPSVITAPGVGKLYKRSVHWLGKKLCTGSFHQCAWHILGLKCQICSWAGCPPKAQDGMASWGLRASGLNPNSLSFVCAVRSGICCLLLLCCFAVAWPGQRWQIVGTRCAVGLVLVFDRLSSLPTKAEGGRAKPDERQRQKMGRQVSLPISAIGLSCRSRFAGKKGAGPFKGLVLKLCGLSPKPLSRILNLQMIFAEPGATTNGKGPWPRTDFIA